MSSFFFIILLPLFSSVVASLDDDALSRQPDGNKQLASPVVMIV